MNELRSFLIAAAGTLGLLEVTNSEQLMPTDSDPETLAIKAIITLVAGFLSTFLTRLFRRAKDESAKKARRAGTRQHQPASKEKLIQTTKNK